MSRPGKVQRRLGAPVAFAAPGEDFGPGAGGFTSPPPDAPVAMSEAVLWVPSEVVHLARVSLPLAKPAARLKALPYALEPLLGQSLDDTHVALGPATGDAQYLACAISRKAMQTYSDRAGKTAKLVPDVFMLPVPPTNAWNVGEIGGRVLVRTPDGAGFATARDNFASFREAAGRPRCLMIFGSSEGISDCGRDGAVAWTGHAGLLDLRQGVFATSRTSEVGRPVLQAQIAAAVAAAFTLALGAEAWAVSAAVDRYRLKLSASLAAKYPRFPETEDAVSAIEQMSAQLANDDASGMIAVLSAAAATFPPSGEMSLQRAQFNADRGRLDLSLEAGSVDALYDYTSKLETEGLFADVTQAEAIPGGAQGLVSVSAKGSAP